MTMALNYAYPTYKMDITSEILDECCDIAVRLLKEVGMEVGHERFLDTIKRRSGIKIEGKKVRFEEALVRKNLERCIAESKEVLKQKEEGRDNKWRLMSNGYSMCVIDIETDEIRPATCQDLRDLIKLKDSFGIVGSYPVMPQDLPPLMRAIACFKICCEASDKTRPYDYQNIKQTRYIYEMCKVMGKSFEIVLNISRTMAIDRNDMDVFFDFYPDWKKGGDISLTANSYPMLGINKPITATGCIALHMAEMLGVQVLFNLFDPEIKLAFKVRAGYPTDMRHTCWAFGSPKAHLYAYLNSRIFPNLCKCDNGNYTPDTVRLETSSSAVDEQAALEKIGVAMVAALQGCKSFSYAGNLCVDDLFSGVQFVIDVEIFNYIKETIESFDPHPDIFSMDGLYEMLRDVSIGKEQFLSHPDTAAKLRNILPSSERIHREKLSSWFEHRKTLKDRAREECIERIKNFPEYHLPEDKQKELDAIYKRANADLVK